MSGAETVHVAYPNSSRAPTQGGPVICPGGLNPRRAPPARRRGWWWGGLCPLMLLAWWSSYLSGKGYAAVCEEEGGVLTGVVCLPAVEQMRIGLWRCPAIAVRDEPHPAGFVVSTQVLIAWNGCCF
jgi:hypothetical protein